MSTMLQTKTFPTLSFDILITTHVICPTAELLVDGGIDLNQ